MRVGLFRAALNAGTDWAGVVRSKASIWSNCQMLTNAAASAERSRSRIRRCQPRC
jgi:hypothetical protein